MNRSAIAATLALLASGAHAAEFTIDFDAIPNPNFLGGPFDFPTDITEDGFTLSPADGRLQVWETFQGGGDTGLSDPNYIRPASNPPANATLAIEEEDGSAFRFVGLNGGSSGPIAADGTPLASGHITVRGFTGGALAAQDVFEVATGQTGGIVDPAIPFTAINLAGVAVDRLEIVLDGFDSGIQPSPQFYALADNIRLDTDATVLQTVNTDLVAGQTIPVGAVQVSQNPATCTATVTLNTNFPWCVTEAHLATGDTLADIPQTKKGDPIPGQFADSAYPACEGEVVFENVTGGSLFAVHAVVYDTLNGTDETAWGAGTAFAGKNWATYVELPGGCQSYQ